MITQTKHRRLLASSMLAAAFLTGCEAWDGDPVARPGGNGQLEPVQAAPDPNWQNRPSNEVATPYAPQPAAPPPPYTGDPDRRDVPDDARLVIDGKGLLQYRSPRDGMIFVVDADRDELVWKGQINRNETISVEPDGNRILIDKIVVCQQDMKKKDKHKVFFLRQ